MKTGALEQKTTTELRRLAARARLAGRSRMRKSQLIRAILKDRRNRGSGRPTAAAKAPVLRKAPRRSASARIRTPKAAARRAAARRKQKAPVSLETNVRAPRQRTRELPAAYGKTRVTLMEVDPGRAYAYWEVTPQDRIDATRRLGEGAASARWVLRFYESAGNVAEDRRRGRHFDVDVDLAPGNWYVTLPAGGRSYRAELGPVDAEGNFTAACQSNPVHVPRDEASPHYAPRWMNVRVNLAEAPGPRHRPQVPNTASFPHRVPDISEAGWDIAFDEQPGEPWSEEETGRPAPAIPIFEDASSFELGKREDSSPRRSD